MLSADVAVLLNRIALGAYFALAGVRKLIPAAEQTIWDKWQGFAQFVKSEAPLPDFLGLAYGYALPPVEIVTGVLLVLGYRARIASVLIALMLISFLIAKSDGDWWPAAGPAFPANVILLTLSLWLTVSGAGRLSLDRKSIKS